MAGVLERAAAVVSTDIMTRIGSGLAQSFRDVA
jgi:hypothetical protein